MREAVDRRIVHARLNPLLPESSADVVGANALRKDDDAEVLRRGRALVGQLLSVDRRERDDDTLPPCDPLPVARHDARAATSTATSTQCCRIAVRYRTAPGSASLIPRHDARRPWRSSFTVSG